MEGRLGEIPAWRDSIFGVHVLSAVPEVPADVLNPRSARLDPDEHDRRARPLKAMFHHNMGRTGEAASVAGWWQPILLARIGELQMPALGRLVQAKD